MFRKVFTLKSRYQLVMGLFFSLVPFSAFATVSIDSYKLNDAGVNVTLNPSSGQTVNISLVASEPVKFNTIAICATSDTVCSRSTAVKYFSQTDRYDTGVTKPWDGKKSSGEAVSNGEYKIKVTLAVEGVADTVAVELSNPLIIIDSDYSGGGTGGSSTSGEEEAETSHSSTGGSGQSTATTKAVTSKKKGAIIVAPELAIVNSPVDLEVPLSSEYASYKLTWSFGDGQSARGRRATHIYRRPGTYVIALTAKTKTAEEVFRVTVKVVPTEIKVLCPENGELKIQNNSGEEINLGGWHIVTGSDKFVLTKNTILLPEAELFFDSYDLGFEINKGKYLEFIAPNGVVVATCGHKPWSAEDKARLEKIIDIENETLTIARSFVPAVSPQVKPKIELVKDETNNQGSSTATSSDKVYVLTKSKASPKTGLFNFLASQVKDLIN